MPRMALIGISKKMHTKVFTRKENVSKIKVSFFVKAKTHHLHLKRASAGQAVPVVNFPCSTSRQTNHCTR